ncbi:MAG: hypothetical protein WCO71_01940 [Pseudomonadota bacterium]
MRQFFMLLTTIILITNIGCKKSEKFPPIGDQVVSPIDVAVDASGTYFYALNSDYPRDYNEGSLLVLTTDGQKVGVTGLPRLGRSLTVAGNALIITFSNSGETASQVMLFDITTPNKPVLAKTFQPAECNPINALAKASYGYWAVTCSNGRLFAGDLGSDLSTSTLNHVRDYPESRRALHIDTTRNLLLAFATDMGDQRWGDQLIEDSKTYGESDDTETNVPNEIPDKFERRRTDRANKDIRGIYQFAVYDLKAAHDGGWQLKEFKDSLSELRWTYFNLANFDGTPDVAQTVANINTRYYRTNFWDAKPDPEDGDVFYLSHRGTADGLFGGSLHANSILKVRIMGNLTDMSFTTSEVLSFERVYGFKGELDPSGRQFPGDFEIANVQGRPLLVVNHFRDLKNWPSQPYFSIAAKVIGENHWFDEISSTFSAKSYYQVALTTTGRAIAANFYGNSLILLDVTPGVGITELATVIK